MKWWKSPWLVTIVIAIIIVASSNWYIEQIMEEDTVPEDALKSRLEVMYQGTVQQMTEGDAGYEAQIMRNGALYSATVDHKTGKVKAMTLLKEAKPDVAKVPEEVEEKPEPVQPKPVVDQKPEPEPAKKPVPAPTPAPAKPVETPKPQPKPQVQPTPQPEKKKSVILTGQQAVNIALKRLNASVPVEVDDVDFVETQQGGYYLVELELDTEADLDEVVYQIHAISGKVLSVSWDD